MGELEKLVSAADMQSLLKLLVVLAVTAEVIHAFPGFPGFGAARPQNDVLSVLMERELCAPESLAKMSSVCRMVCQAFCGLLKVAKAPSPTPPAYPYGISGYSPVSYNPVPIYQSPLYYPKQGWGGKDKQDWAEWAKEKEGGSDEKAAASQNKMKKKKEEKEHVHEEEDQARPRTFPDDDEDEGIQLIQKAIRGNHDHYHHDHRDHHESGRW